MIQLMQTMLYMVLLYVENFIVHVLQYIDVDEKTQRNLQQCTSL